MNRNTGIFLLFLLMPAMVLLTHNHIANWHYHISSIGIPVKHAHPFNKTDNPASPFANHSHTAMEMHFLSQFAHFAHLLAAVLLLLIPVLIYSKKVAVKHNSFPFLEQLFFTLPSLRAPPCVLIK
jgi:hypothetical protein